MQSKTKGSGLIALLAVALIVGVVLTLFFRQSGGKEGGNAYLQAIDKAKRVADQNKIRVLQTEITHFKLDEGRLPESLDELVENGYSSPKAIVDGYGEPLGYENGKVWLVEQHAAKMCSKCKKKVPGNSKQGDKCPHCGATWK